MDRHPENPEQANAETRQRLNDERRERIATAALAGLLAYSGEGTPTNGEAAFQAVQVADALLRELAKPKAEAAPKPVPDPEPTAGEIAADLDDIARRDPDTDLF